MKEKEETPSVITLVLVKDMNDFIEKAESKDSTFYTMQSLSVALTPIVNPKDLTYSQLISMLGKNIWCTQDIATERKNIFISRH